MNPRSADGERFVQTTSLVVLATVAVGFALRWLRPVLIPFVLALFIALVLSIFAEWLATRAKLPRRVALVATLIFGLGILVSFGGLVRAAIAQLADNAPFYAQQVGILIDRTAAALPEELATRIGEGGKELREIPVTTVGALLASSTNALLGVFSQSLLVLIFVIFLLLGGSRGAPTPASTLAEVHQSVGRYLIVKIMISATTGFLVALVLSLLGVPLAMIFGVLAFLLNFIPNIGSVIATLLPLPVVFVSSGVSGVGAITAIVALTLVQIGMGNFVEPRWMGQSLDLHPVAVLLSLITWGMLWGVVGMFLATPITAVMKLLLEKFEGSRPVAELLAGRLPVGQPAD